MHHRFAERNTSACCLLFSSSVESFVRHCAGENSGVTINERSSAIVGNQWDVLDFGEIEKEVAENLSDADIERVLQCIGALIM